MLAANSFMLINVSKPSMGRIFLPGLGSGVAGDLRPGLDITEGVGELAEGSGLSDSDMYCFQYSEAIPRSFIMTLGCFLVSSRMTLSFGLEEAWPTMVGPKILARLERGILLLSHCMATRWRCRMRKASVSLLAGGSWAMASRVDARQSSPVSHSRKVKMCSIQVFFLQISEVFELSNCQKLTKLPNLVEIWQQFPPLSPPTHYRKP